MAEFAAIPAPPEGLPEAYLDDLPVAFSAWLPLRAPAGAGR